MAAEETKRRTEEEGTQRIVVALDASPNSVAALRAAAELASALDVELEGLFVEDVDLMQLCGFPYQQEVGSYTGAVRRLDDRALQRQMRALAASIRQVMAREANRGTVRWHFQVRRGPVVNELLDASRTAAMLSLGRTRRGRQRRLGSTAESIVLQSSRPVLILGEEGELRLPLTVVYTGTEASDRALSFALNLRRQASNGVRIVVWPSEKGQQIDDLGRRAISLAQEADVDATIVAAAGGDLSSILARQTGTLVLAREQVRLLSDYGGPAILVP